MDKINFNDMNLEYSQDTEILNFNGFTIELKTYLPIEQCLNMIADVINAAADANKFYNPGKIDVAFAIYAIKYYTNIEFTEDELSDLPRIYDIIATSGLYASIKDIIEDELSYVKQLTLSTVEAIYKYHNSLLGILDSVNTDYTDLKLDAEEITKNLSDKDNLTLLKDVMTKLG